MSVLSSTIKLLRSAVGPGIGARRTVTAKPAKNELSAAEQGVGLVVLFTSILAPTAYFLTHLEGYKNPEAAPEEDDA